MKLGEFIKEFSHNNMIRLVYQIKGGYKTVLESWDDVSMDHEINKSKGKNRHYINNKVLGVVGILNAGKHYTEAINIIIERLDNQPFIEEISNEPQNNTETWKK
jgi:hypothetical protein